MSETAAVVELIRRVERDMDIRITEIQAQIGAFGVESTLGEIRAILAECQSALTECRALVAAASVREARAESAAEDAAESIAEAIEEAIEESTDETADVVAERVEESLPPELIDDVDIPPERTPFLERPVFGKR